MTRRTFLELPAAAIAAPHRAAISPQWPRWVTFAWIANTYGSFRWLAVDPLRCTALVEPMPRQLDVRAASPGLVAFLEGADK